MSKNDAFDNQCWSIEIEKKSDVEAARPQVRAHLGEEDVFEALDGFQFQDDLGIDNQVKSLSSQINSLVKYMNLFLALKGNPSMLKGYFHRLLINWLDKTWPKRLVDVYGRCQDSARKLLELVCHPEVPFGAVS